MPITLRIQHALLLLLLSASLCAAAQDSVSVDIRWGTTDKQLTDILRFQGIEQNELFLTGKKLKGKIFTLSYEEYKEGKIIKTAVLTKGLPDNLMQATEDTFRIKLLSQPHGDSTSIAFMYPRFTSQTYYKTVEQAGHYSMRNVASSDGKNFLKLPANKEKQAIFSYSLPYETAENPGQQFYCKLTSEGIPPSQWWEKYHVKHYFIFYLQIS